MKLSPEELEKGQLNLDTLSQALTLIKVNGYVVFEKVLSEAFIKELHADYLEIFNRYIQNPDPTFSKNHYRVYLPFRQPYCDERVIANSMVLPILNDLLGDDFVCHYVATNTCAPGSELQPAHSDVYPLFPGSDIKPPPYLVVVNIPLVDVTMENGPIEFWAGGTHLNTYDMDTIAALAPHMPSEYATMPAGSLMIRDGRMWHRGTENKSNEARPQIALVYTRPWVDSGTRRTGIPQETYDSLSERARTIFRDENIGGELDKVTND